MGPSCCGTWPARAAPAVLAVLALAIPGSADFSQYGSNVDRVLGRRAHADGDRRGRGNPLGRGHPHAVTRVFTATSDSIGSGAVAFGPGGRGIQARPRRATP